MKVNIKGYIDKVEDNHFIMWMENHEQIKAILKTYYPVQFTPLREYQKVKIWGGKLYKSFKDATPSEVFTEVETCTIECIITKTPKAINITAQQFIFN